MPLRKGLPVRLAVYAVLGILALGCALLLVWAIDRGPPRGSITVTMDSNAVPPTGLIRAEYRVEVLRNCPGIIYFWLVSTSSAEFLQPGDQPSPIIPQTRDEAWRAGRPLRFTTPAFKLVPSFPPGEAELHARALFWCNPLQYLAPLSMEYPVGRFRVQRADGGLTP